MDPITLLIVFFITCAIFAIFLVLFGNGPDAVDRANSFTGDVLARDPGFRKRVLWPLWKNIGSVGRKIYPGHVLAGLDKYCLKAGRPFGIGGEMLAGLKVAGTISLGVPCLLLPGLLRLLALLLGLVGYLVPGIWITGKIKSRQETALGQLPDAMDLLVMSVEAGLGLDAAMHRMTDRLGGPLGEVFGRALAEINLGEDREKAFRGIVERLPLDDLEQLMSSIVQAEQLGISVGTVLRTQAEGLRRRRKLRAEEHARKAPIKILFPMVLFIFPSLFVVILGPAIITLIKELGSR